MGNGTKFKLANVLPNVFSKIKGIRKSRKPKASSSSPTHSEFSDIDPNDFFIASKNTRRNRTSSPVRTFPQSRDRGLRCPSSPDCTSLPSDITYNIRFPAQSPITGRASKMRPHSPTPGKCHSQSDPGCRSFDSAMLMMPPDGRVRRAAPQAFAKCLILSKCKSFNGSTHSDSDISDIDTPEANRRVHSRASSIQLDGTSWERQRERYETAHGSSWERERRGDGRADGFSWERERRGDGRADGFSWERERDRYGTADGSSWERERERYETADESVIQGSTYQKRRERKENNLNTKTHGQLRTVSPVHTVRCVLVGTPPAVQHSPDHIQENECQRSACPDSSREETDLDQNGVNCPLSRRLSFTTDDNLSRHFDDTSFSSDDDFYRVRGERNTISQYELLPASMSFRYVHVGDVDAGYTSSEVQLTEDERSHPAKFRRAAALAKTVRNASDSWARGQSRFSEEDKQRSRRMNYDYERGHSEVLVPQNEMSHAAAVYRRETSLVRTVLSAQDWARENLKALDKANEPDREKLARLRAGPLDHFLVRDEVTDKNVEYETFGLPPNSREFHSRRSSRNENPIGEVEKHTRGRIDYRSSSPQYRPGNDCRETIRLALPEDFAQTVANYSNDHHKLEPTENLETEISRPWDTEVPSFHSDSVLVGRGRMGSGMPEQTTFAGFSESECPTPRTVRYSEHETTTLKLGQHHNASAGKISSRSLSPRQEVISNSLQNLQLSCQPQSYELTNRRKLSRSPSPIEEFASGHSPSPVSSKKLSSRSPSSPVDLPRNKRSHTLSSGRDQSPRRNPKTVAEVGMQRLDSVAVVKASYDPYRDFRESMVEMILENDIQSAGDLEDLLQCYLSLNSSEYHEIIVRVFSDIWGDIFDQ